MSRGDAFLVASQDIPGWKRDDGMPSLFLLVPRPPNSTTVALWPLPGRLAALGFRRSGACALLHRPRTLCRGDRTGRPAPAQFLPGETSISIFVQAFQGLARVGDLAGIDDPVVIGIQRGYHERRRRLGALSR